MEDMGLRNCGVLYLPFEKEQREMKMGAAWSVDDPLRIAFRKRADIQMKMGWGGVGEDDPRPEKSWNSATTVGKAS